ncbi:MAG: XkdF-like putative serine protease domain-containing protein [Syntrophaceae bacterium]
MRRKTADYRFFVPITRIDEEKRIVAGYMTREDVKDSYGTFIDLESVKKCLPEYEKWRNVREMHQLSAVGVADEIKVDNVGVYVEDYISDDVAWKKVKDGVYKGFSIGGKQDFIIRNGVQIPPTKNYQDGDVIYLKEITEHSIVDRPSNPGCTIDEYRIHTNQDEEGEYMARLKWTCGHKDHLHETQEDATRCINDTIDRVLAGTEDHLDELRDEFSQHIWDDAVKRAEESKAAEPSADKPAAEADPATDPAQRTGEPDLKRYIGEEVWDAKLALQCLDDIIYLYSKEMSEGHPEVAAQLEALKGAIENLKKFIMSEIQEVTIEDKIAMAAGALNDVVRKGAKHSADTLKTIQAMHDQCVSLGCRCDTANCEECTKAGEPDLTRSANDLKRVESLESELAESKTTIAGLIERIDRLEAQPAAPVGVLRAVGGASVTVTKEGDNGGQNVKRVEESDDFKRAKPEDQALMLMRASLSNPIPVVSSKP